MRRSTGRRARLEETDAPIGFWRRLGKGLKILFRISVLLGSCFLLYQLYWLLVYSEFFRIERIEVYGCRQCTPESVMARLPWSEGDSLWTINLKKSVESVLAEPWVKRVTVRRALPRRVEIHLTERTPVAAIPDDQGSRYYGLDDRGVVLPVVAVVRGAPHLLNRDASPRLPIVTGLDASEVQPGHQIDAEKITPVLELITVLGQSHPTLAAVLFEFNISKPESIVGYPSIRVKKVYFGAENFSQRITRLAEVWKYLEREAMHGESIDLRFDDQGVVFSPSEQQSQERAQPGDARNVTNTDGGMTG